MLQKLRKLFREDLDALIIILGIYSCYLYFGILQEHIYTSPNRDTFVYPEFVVFCQLIISYLLSTAFLHWSPSNKRPLPPYNISFGYGGAFGYSMFLTNYSLTLISYPTQALAKSCKLLPAMIGSLFVKDIKYHPLQYLSVVLITLGVFAFNFSGKKGATSDSALGLLALFTSLSLDGLTSFYSETCKRVHKSTALSAQQLCSGFGALFIFPIVILNNIILAESTLIEYLVKFPDVITDILLFSLLSGIGNYFVFWGLNFLGSLNLVIVTTTRKFMTILLSIIWFSHSLSELQAVCILLVVIGAGLDIYVGHSDRHKKEKH